MGNLFVCPSCRTVQLPGILRCINCDSELISLGCSSTYWEKLDDDAKNRLVAEALSKAAPATTRRAPASMASPGKHAAPTTNRPIALDNQTIEKPHGNPAIFVIAVIAAIFFVIAGFQMTGITSVLSIKENTASIMETFYHAMGIMSFGFAALSIALGLMGWRRG